MVLTKRHKRTAITVLAAVVLLLVAVLVFFSTRTSQRNLEYPSGDNFGSSAPIVTLPIERNPITVEIAPGLSFKFDTGSDISTITPEVIDRLDSMGFEVRESIYPVAGRDGRGDIDFCLRRYTVDLPFFDNAVTADSLGNVTYTRSAEPKVFRNIDFVMVDNAVPTLGIDFIEKFVVEYQPKLSTVALYDRVPEHYEVCARMKPSRDPIHWSKLGHRYYVRGTVERMPVSMFLDTGLRYSFVKMNASDTTRNRHPLIDGHTNSFIQEHDCRIDTASWIQIGNREGLQRVYYYNSTEEGHAFNPLNILYLDVVLDFPGRNFMLRR